MKRFSFCSYILTVVLCIACYEGEDLTQTFESYNELQTLIAKSSNVTQLSAKIDVVLSNPKFNSKVDLYYSEQPEANLISSGNRQTFSVADADHIISSSPRFSLSGLFPDTEYRYIAVYTDVSGKEVKSEEGRFKTLGFYSFCMLRPLTYFECTVYTHLDDLFSGVEPGYIYGLEDNLTFENAIGSDVVSFYDRDISAGCYDTISGLRPGTQYFLRPYVKYKGRIYYGDTGSGTTPKINVTFSNPSAKVIINKVIITSRAKLNNLANNSLYVLPELEYGILLSEQPHITYETATRHIVTPSSYGEISYIMNDALPTVTYYAKAFVRWEDQVFLSEELSFTFP